MRLSMLLIVVNLLAVALALALHLPPAAAPPRSIVIDGKFDDWKDVAAYTDPPHNEHDTAHNGPDDKPRHVEHADVDLLEYKLTHDADNLYAYFRARGVIGRSRVGNFVAPAGRYYAILAVDVDHDETTGYWLHGGGFYPTSGGYDVNTEIEWYAG